MVRATRSVLARLAVILSTSTGLALGCAADHPEPVIVPTPPGPHRFEMLLDGGGWQVHADAPWWAHVDLRNMLDIFHPLVVSATGAWAGASREIIVPSGWSAPLSLRFVCADNYFADPKERPGSPGVENFVEHRYKQVLIDDHVVWERDVADAASRDAPTEFTVDVTPYVRPGQRLRLTLRVIDKASTTTRHARDVRFVKGTSWAPGDGRTELPPRFHTQAWFADPVLGEAAAVAGAPPGQRPHEAAARERHRSRGPIVPRGAPPSSRATLELLAPVAIPEPGFPLEIGIPLPRGSLREAAAARLADGDGRELQIQARPAAFWPDGSLRWIVLQTLLPGGARPHARFALTLDGAAPRAPRPGVTATRSGSKLRVETGALTIEAGGSPRALVDTITAPRRAAPLLRDLTLRMAMRLDGRVVPVVAERSEIEIVDEGPVALTFEVRGTLEAPSLHVGRFTLRITAYAGSSILRSSIRVIDDVKPSPFVGTEKDAPLEIEDLALVAAAPSSAHPRAGRGGVIVSSRRALEVVQESVDRAAVSSHEGRAEQKGKIDGWIATDTVEVAGWRFAEQYPKALRADGKTIEIGLFRSTRAAPLYRPRFGEAKRHDLWLRFAPDPAGDAAFAALANEPPRLFDAPWFAQSGAAGVHDPAWFAHQPEIARWAERVYGAVLPADWPGHFGIRDFGDMPYSPLQWKNGYWTMIEGAIVWGLAGGNPRWLERGHEVARHVADVDSVHVRRDHPDFHVWGGLTCAVGRDHSVHGGAEIWASFQAGDQLLLDAWMTGDRDSLADGLANAEYLVRTKLGVGSPGVRDQTRSIRVLLRAWYTTRDDRYLDAARRYLDLDAMRRKLLDFRRGAYLTPIYKNWWIVSAGLDSMYVLAVDEYYRATGDERAAELEVAIADAVHAEAMLPGEEGLGSFIYYPRYSRSAWYYPQMAILFHIAFDLTQDTRFLRAARAAFARYLLTKTPDGRPNYQPVWNMGALDPELGGWMLEHRDVKTEPFTVHRETPDPDPAQFVPPAPG